MDYIQYEVLHKSIMQPVLKKIYNILVTVFVAGDTGNNLHIWRGDYHRINWKYQSR